MSILEKYRSRCPNCNQSEVQLEDDGGVYCSYCENIWGSIYTYKTDCELKEKEWELESKIDALEDRIDEARNWSKLHCSRDQNRQLQQILLGHPDAVKTNPV